MPAQKTERTPKRKTHTKSRKGCLQCKQRHTKCNEAKPRCGNCVRLDIHCNWPIIPDSYSAASPQSPDTPISAINEHHHLGSAGSAGAGLESALCIVDLRLLHHWTTKGAKSLHPNLPSKHLLWQNDLIEIAFEHPFVLHGILALSAIHKATSDPRSDRQSLLSQADSHISRALIPYKNNLHKANNELAMPMFVLSSTLVTYHLGSAQLERPEDPIAALHHCFRLLKGVKVVMEPHGENYQSTEIFTQMVDLAYIEALDTLSVNDSVPEILELSEISNLLLDPADKQACISAIDALHTTFKRLRKLTPDRDEYLVTFLWPAMVSDHFLHLMAVHNPVACVLIAYFAALLASTRDVWWVGEWPERISTATQKVLVGKPELQKWLIWPIQIITARLERREGG